MGIEVGFLSVVRLLSSPIISISLFRASLVRWTRPTESVIIGECTPKIGGHEVDLSLSRAIEGGMLPKRNADKSDQT